MKLKIGNSHILIKFCVLHINAGGRRSAVGIANWLRPGRSGDRIPVRSSFFVYAQTGPKAHRAFCKKGTGFVSGEGEKRSEHFADHTPLLALRLRMCWSYISTCKLYLYMHVTMLTLTYRLMQV
jgi:hypothetical protein